jgi:hypothetical protein
MAVRVNKYICDGCINCLERRLGVARYWFCLATPHGENAWRLEEGELAPLGCPLYKAQVREIPLLIVCGSGNMYHTLERNIRRATANVRVRAVWLRDERKLYGLQDFEVFYGARWQESPMVRLRGNHAFLMEMISRRRRS